jgi:hypothetical protein
MLVMIKLSITLPNSAQLSIEADEPDMIREVLGFTLPQLGTVANDLAAVNGAISGHPTSPNGIGDGGDAAGIQGSNVDGVGVSSGTLQAAVEPAAVSHRETEIDQHPAPSGPEAEPQRPVTVAPPRAAPAPVTGVVNQETDGITAVYPSEPSTPAEQEFVGFCQKVSPLGDMRRVVVAAEASARFLHTDSVDPDELARLFTLAHWPLPHSFVQTLRNAARTKFRWLERIPGRPGHYRVTNTGRSIVLGESANAVASTGPARPAE